MILMAFLAEDVVVCRDPTVVQSLQVAWRLQCGGVSLTLVEDSDSWRISFVGTFALIVDSSFHICCVFHSLARR